MAKYIKKPVVIDAVLWTGKNHREMFDFLTGSENEWMTTTGEYFFIDHNRVKGGLVIRTPEGPRNVNINDYVVKKKEGVFSPYHPKDFNMIYVEGGIGELSDGYHTFNELYYHRMILFATICNNRKEKAWKSKLHHDGDMHPNYFIVGIKTSEGQFTYHYHIDHFDLFDVAELERAPEFDGHTSNDVTRLLSL